MVQLELKVSTKRLDGPQYFYIFEFTNLDRLFNFLQTSLQLGSKLLQGFGVMSDDVNFLSQLLRNSMELQAQEVLGRNDDRENESMKPLQVCNVEKND